MVSSPTSESTAGRVCSLGSVEMKHCRVKYSDGSNGGGVVACSHSSMCSSSRSSHHAIHPQPDSRNTTRRSGGARGCPRT